MRSATITSFFLSGLAVAEAASIRRAAAGTATVDLSKDTGAATSSASGWIYGFNDNGTNVDTRIPSNYISDIKFKASRAGGAQIAARGWVGGMSGYQGRFQSTLSNYRTTRKYGGTFILLVHDIWGADGSGVPMFPGDNNNWTETDKFLTQLASDIKANNMLEGLVLDIWNEPDIDTFWKRTWDQYLSYYVRATKHFREALPNTLISGPSAANVPTVNDQKWKQWLNAITTNNVVPDHFSWHQIGDWQNEPDRSIPDFKTMKAAYNIPDKPIDINEYAWPTEQQPAGTAWYISQLERWNLLGLRANWGGGAALHDYLANIVGKQGSTYYANGEWFVYKYYADMVGTRVATKAAADRKFDVFAVKSGNTVKLLAGTRLVKRAYDISISGLASVGLPDSGTVSAKVTRFDWAGKNGKVSGPVDMGMKTFTISSGKLTIPVDPATNETAYAFEFSGKSH